jgi:hypothetical protein
MNYCPAAPCALARGRVRVGGEEDLWLVAAHSLLAHNGDGLFRGRVMVEVHQLRSRLEVAEEGRLVQEILHPHALLTVRHDTKFIKKTRIWTR